MTVYRIDGSVLDTYTFTADPRPCVSAFDCGALPPDCAGGEWACVADACEIASCGPAIEPVEAGEDPGPEPVPEPVWDASMDTSVPPDAPADTGSIMDVDTDPSVPDAVEEPGQAGEDASGCGCALAS